VDRICLSSVLILKDTAEVRHLARHTIEIGGVIAFRTDTFYGLGADPLNAPAVHKIKQLKSREENKPILLLISDIEQVERFVDNADSYRAIASQYWPAPLTLIGVARADLPDDVTAASNSIGLRLPNDDDLRKLLRACGGALTATSANLSGSLPARTAQKVESYFPTGIDLIIDGGAVTSTEPSTVVDISGDRPRLVREGAIKRPELVGLL
jgi:L-threonylcarbamoyladenylate synthase